MEPLLRWLNAGNSGYTHSHADTNTPNTKALNCTSSGAFADDLICLSGSYQNLRLQAMKLTQYADWAHLIISGKKTKDDENKTLRGNTSVADFAHHQLANKVLVQGQAAQFRTVLKPDDPFPYLGVHITMDLIVKHHDTLKSNCNTS